MPLLMSVNGRRRQETGFGRATAARRRRGRNQGAEIDVDSSKLERESSIEGHGKRQGEAARRFVELFWPGRRWQLEDSSSELRGVGNGVRLWRKRASQQR
ncbi:hypothetical protein PR202_ga09379 [Eleusine coracana subsp. coracana]|uniref:Uncharacterized protein n=1 Tax=Eleusine coracana subsp. coracana TaxID=191504 RepID=A0AAV5C4V6_ELECO|nr:hypothetical protein PR202_ga09379 [Eleusine coracana subsp. coracana]